MDSLTIRKPDDWHVHIRDGAFLKAVLPFTMKRFGRAIVMPNLSPEPVVGTSDVLAYRSRIVEATAGSKFIPLMTYYLTEESNPLQIGEGYANGFAQAVKMYPVNATTNSALGVSDIEKVYPVFEKMQELFMPLLVHGETVMTDGKEIPPEDREKVFLDSTLPKLLKDFPALKIVLEHASTKSAIDFVISDTSGRLASTITLHHLLETREEVEKDDHSAYLACTPVIKTEADRKALRAAATSGDSRFFLGTDSAPHTVSAKEKTPPPVGVFTAPAALELYAGVFDEEGKLENLEAFASMNGAAFYGLQPNEETIMLQRKEWTIDSLIDVGNGETLRPFGYHEDPAKRLKIKWSII